MTPSSTPSRRVLKKPPANSSGSCHAVRIQIRPSRIHQGVQFGIAACAMLAPINAQLPWQLTGFILLWTLAAVAHWKMRACHCNAIVDEGDQWLVEFQNRSDRVRYQQTDYCSAYLIVIQFRTRTGKPRRVCVWRDAVSPAAFSWLAARIRLTSPDRKVKIMATSQLSALNSTQQRALH